MPIDDHDKKMTKLIWRGIIVALILGVAAGICIGLIANNHAGRAIDCTNASLSERNPQGQHYDNAVSDAFYVIYLRSKGQIDDSAAQKRFLHDAAVVHRVELYRAAHPLGKC